MEIYTNWGTQQVPHMEWNSGLTVCSVSCSRMSASWGPTLHPVSSAASLVYRTPETIWAHACAIIQDMSEWPSISQVTLCTLTHWAISPEDTLMYSHLRNSKRKKENTKRAAIVLPLYLLFTCWDRCSHALAWPPNVSFFPMGALLSNWFPSHS